MDKRQLAAQLFLDAVNGQNMRAQEAKNTAIWSWEMAEIFEANAPQMPKFIRTKGCKTCHGSGGKASSPCGVCNGSGMVPA